MAPRVVHVVLSLEIGGLEVLVLQMARATVQRNEPCTIVCLDRGGPLVERARHEGIDVHVLGRKGSTIDRKALAGLRSILSRGDVNIVHTHNIEAMFYGSLASLGMRRCNVVHTQHGIPVPFSPKNRIKSGLSSRRVSRFVCVSRDVQEYLERFWLFRGLPYQAIRNGIDTGVFRPDVARRQKNREALNIAESDIVLICVARLSEVKNHRRLISVFDQLDHESTRYHLWLVGDGPLADVIRKAIDASHYGDRIRMLGERHDIDTLLSASDLFVLASDSEGISVSVLEAMASGLVPVVTRVGGNPEIVDDGHNGYCVEPDREDVFAQRINRLGSDHLLRNTLSRQAQSMVVNEFSLEKMIDSYRDIYLELCNPN